MHRRWLYIVGLICIASIWGFNFGVSRLGMDTFDARLFVFLRFGIAVVFLFLILYWKEGGVRIAWRDLPIFISSGVIGITLLEMLVMYSIEHTTLANASLLNVAPWPIFVALLAPLFMKEKISFHVILGGAIAMIGVILVISGGGEGINLSETYMLGNFAALLVSVLGAIMNLTFMRLMKRYTALRVTTWQIFMGAVFLFPFTLNSWTKVAWSSLGAVEIGMIVYNVFFCTVIAFLVWNVCMFRVGATSANFFRYVVPVAAVISGFVMFDEQIGWLQMAGACCMAAGLLWISLERKRNVSNS